MKRAFKRIYADFIDIMDFIIVKTWGVFYGLIEHVKNNPRKAVILTAVFLSALTIFCEISCIATHSLSFGGLLALVVAVTVFFYILWEIFKRRENR